MLRRPGGADFAPGAHVFAGGSVHAEDRLLGDPLRGAAVRELFEELGILLARGPRGFATEAAQAMIDWAAREHGVLEFISGVTPDNAPSLRVNDKLGFVRTGDFVDGEIIFELHRP